MEFRILGPLEVLEEGRGLPVSGAKQRALLALLLLHANEVVSSDRLLDALWGAEPPVSGRTALRVCVSQLRKALGRADVLVTRMPGYALVVEPDALDLHRFERLVAEADGAEPAVAAGKLREALALWRGAPLADIAYEPFAQPAIARLEELRVVAIERRIESDLHLGRPDELVPELHSLVREHPLRERLRCQLMIALYRSGRQAEALEAYRDARRTLVEELGLEPGRALHDLQAAILAHDAALGTATVPTRSLLVVPADERRLDALVALAEPLGRQPPREVIVAWVVDRGRLPEASARLGELSVRAAAFASATPGRDIVRLAAEQDADLILVDGALTPEIGVVLDAAPCDVALVPEARDVRPLGPDDAVLVPFTGAEHDWVAVELAAWVSRASDAPLVLAGSSEGPLGGDASRLLASASLIVQRAVGIRTSPLLVEPGVAGLVSAARDAGLVVFGLPREWRSKGLGRVRAEVAREAQAPTLVVRKGVRPGGLAPPASHTRYTWSLRR